MLGFSHGTERFASFVTCTISKRQSFFRRVPGQFNKLPHNQVIEQTINKDQKRPGGVKGFSTTEGTVKRWILSSHSVSSINADLVGTYLEDQTLESSPKDLSKERMALDERKISKCYQTLRISVLSKLLDFLKKDIPQVESLPSSTILNFDGMVMLQKLPPQLRKFGEISDYIFRKIVKEGDGTWVFFVTDQYFPDSVKLLERQRRTRSKPTKVNVTRRSQLKPLQFDKFLKMFRK